MWNEFLRKRDFRQKRKGLGYGFLVILTLLMACTTTRSETTPTEDLPPTEDTTYLTPIPESTLAIYDWNAPIENRLQAVIAGLANLGSTRLQFSGNPKVVSVDRLSLEEAHKRTAQAGVLDNGTRSGDRLVWLVVFEGDYQIIPPDPEHTFTPSTPAHGCSFVILDPEGSIRSEIGTLECSP